MFYFFLTFPKENMKKKLSLYRYVARALAAANLATSKKEDDRDDRPDEDGSIITSWLTVGATDTTTAGLSVEIPENVSCIAVSLCC